MSDDDISERLSRLDGWTIKDNCLAKDYKFKDFTSAWAFMNDLARTAESLNHHPDWSNSYNKVSISLTTHSAGGLTDKDFAFAEAAEKAAKR
jgi:4a-hydroxytetrahydrobiopterin dehydratase